MAGRGSIEAGRAFVRLFVNDSALVRGLMRAQQRLRNFGQSIQAVGQMFLGMGTTALLPVGLAVKRFADFDDVMREVQAVTRATDADFAKLTETAKNLGATTSFTALQVGALMAELGRAGFSPDQVNEMTDAVLNLSRATGTEAAQSAGIMASAIRQFGLGADDATRVADAFTTTANSTFNSVEQLGEAMGYAGKISADFGMSIEDTLAILGGLGNVGIQGSAAGTAMRRLTTLSGAEAEKLKRIFGVSFIDAAGNARPLVDVLGEVNDATKDLGTGVRAAKFNEAFGLLGITAASAIGSAAGDIKGLAQTIKEAGGAAEKGAAAMDAGLGGSFRILMSAAEGVAIAIGESLNGEIKSLADWLTKVAGDARDFIQQNRELIVTAVKVAAGVTAIGAALVAVGTAFTAAGLVAGGLSTALTMVGAVAGAVFSPIGLIVAGVTAYVGLLAFAFWKLADPLTALMPLASAVMDAFRGISNALLQGDFAGAFEALADSIGPIMLAATQGVIDIVRNMITNVLGLVTGGSSGMSGAMSPIVSGAKRIFSEVYEAGKLAFNALLLFASDVFDQAPQLLGYAFGAASRTIVTTWLKLQKWLWQTIAGFVGGLFNAFASIGPKLLKALLTGNISGAVDAVRKSMATQMMALGGLSAGLMGGEMPEFTMSPATVAAYEKLAAARKDATGPESSAGTEDAKTKVDDLAAAFDDGTVSAGKFSEGLEEAFKLDPTPAEQYTDRLKELNEALAAGTITKREWASAVSDARDEIFGLAKSPLDDFRARVMTLQQALGTGAIGTKEYAEQLAMAKREILGIEPSNLDEFAERVKELREQFAAGRAISQAEFGQQFKASQQDFLGVGTDPIDKFKQKIVELRAALDKGLITKADFKASALEALPDKVKRVIDETRTPMEKFKKDMAELTKLKSAGLLDNDTFARKKAQLLAERDGQSSASGKPTTFGSFSASALIDSGRTGASSDPQERMAKLLEQGKALSEEQRDELKELRKTLERLASGMAMR